MGPPGTRPLKLLLVDDDPDDLRWFGVILRRSGYEVVAYSSYEEGATHAAREPYDFVLVSQGGPDFEGQLVIKRARELDRHTPILVVTRCPDTPCYLKAMHLGAVGYLPKPTISVQGPARIVETHSSLHETA